VTSPGEKVGKYLIVAKIGSGAMGEVYRAHDPVLNRDVAVKTMAELYASDDQLVQRFRREAQAAAGLNHPNIVTVFDFGEANGQFFLAMELLDGVDLKELIAGRALNDLWDKLDVMEQIAEGLAYAHHQGVVHRDLKPANIRVLPNGRVKIMDFGLARIGTSEMTRTGMVMGTPNYMSPEQVRGEKADARSDIFSLGAVFYELLSGKKAFNADSMHTILFKVLEEEPEPVHTFVPSLPSPFVSFVQKCLAKDPARRFQHAGDLRDALRTVREALASGAYSATDAEGGMPAAGPVDPSAPTVLAPGSVASPRAGAPGATKGANALDLTRVNAPAGETLRGAPTLSGRARTRMGQSAPAAAPVPEAAPSGRWPVYVGGLALVGALVVAGVFVARARTTPLPVTPAAGPSGLTNDQVGALKEALVGNQVELARVDLDNKDYKSAMGRAQRALMLDPSSAEARQVLDQAQRTEAELDAVAREARQAFDAGDTDRAARALARVLALDPRHPVAGELTAALNVHFRKQAEDAKHIADEARHAAEQARAGETDVAGFAQADRAAREASALLQRDEFAVATQKFLESRDGFERSRRTAETAVRAAAAAAARAAATPSTLVARNVPPPPVALPPVSAPANTVPAPTLPAAGPALSGQEPAIRKVIADYGRAIEGKDIALFKAVKPNLTPDEAKRLQEAFKAIKSQQVAITVDGVAVDGGQATVKVSRQDTINGKPVQAIRQVFHLAQAGGGWAIQSIGVQ
jgi:tetratricopeptide (TPR) repeat protein/predicted Ser/Thr protein kinase